MRWRAPTDEITAGHVANEKDAIDLAVDTLGAEFRDLAERLPDHRDTAVTGALVERRMALATVKEVVISLAALP
jgi:hypothetical protein